MKKIILSLAAVMTFALTSDAQTRKGTVLLGAGSEFSEQNINTLAITPKVGYFVQDGIAIGALINFQNHNRDADIELNDNVAEIGVFGRYYVSNNLFTEISLSSHTANSENYVPVRQLAQQWVIPTTNETVLPGAAGGVPQFDAEGNPIIIEYSTGEDGIPDINEVVEDAQNSLKFNLGLGYTIVWREHFAIEPFMNLTFMNGTEKEYNEANRYIQNTDVKGTDFNLGVNFSLFF